MSSVKGIESTMQDIRLQFKKEALSQQALKAANAMHRVMQATPVDTGAAKASWTLLKDGASSDCEYMDVLNHGHSQQAPSHFIERAVLSDPEMRANGIIVIVKA